MLFPTEWFELPSSQALRFSSIQRIPIRLVPMRSDMNRSYLSRSECARPRAAEQNRTEQNMSRVKNEQNRLNQIKPFIIAYIAYT